MPTTILDGETYEQARHRRFTEEAKVMEKVQQDEIIRMAREAGATQLMSPTKYERLGLMGNETIERFAALVAAHAKSDQINTAYQQGCEDMKRRMEKRMQQLESQLQLCQTAVADEREACAKVCDELIGTRAYAVHCAAAIRAMGKE